MVRVSLIWDERVEEIDEWNIPKFTASYCSTLLPTLLSGLQRLGELPKVPI